MSNNLTVEDYKYTDKQLRFCRYILVGKTNNDAWGLAGYSTNYSYEAIAVNASRLLHSPKIQLKLKELRDKMFAPLIASEIERKKVASDVLRARMSDFVDNEGNLSIDDKSQLNTPAVSELSTTRRYTRKGDLLVTTKLKLKDQLDGAKLLNDMEGIGRDRIPQGVTNNLNFMVLTERGKELAEQVSSRLIEAKKGDYELREAEGTSTGTNEEDEGA